jgi:hypothetical protein
MLSREGVYLGAVVVRIFDRGLIRLKAYSDGDKRGIPEC